MEPTHDVVGALLRIDDPINDKDDSELDAALVEKLRKVGYEFPPDREKPIEFLPSDEREVVEAAADRIERLLTRVQRLYAVLGQHQRSRHLLSAENERLRARGLL